MPDLRARETFYRGVRMRSRTEAAFAGCLDGGGDTWWHEGRHVAHVPCPVPYCFAAGSEQYLPDFYVVPKGGRVGVYTEIKGHGEDADWLINNPAEINGYLGLLEVIRESLPSARLAFIPWHYQWRTRDYLPRWWLRNYGSGWFLVDPAGRTTRWEVA
jgi:hypothetical protein